MILEVALLLAIIIFVFLINHRKPKDLPPGEWGLPVIGYMPLSGERPSEMFLRLHAKHGKLFCAKLGSRIYVILGDFSIIKSCFAKMEFADRPDTFTWSIFYHFKNVGIVNAIGEVWSTNRKFALRVLSHFGMGKSKLEKTMKVEVATLIKDLRTKVDKPTKIGWNLNVAILNVIWGLVADKRFNQNDKYIQKFSKAIDENFASLSGPAMVLDLFPWLIPFTPRFILCWMKVNHTEKNRDMTDNFFQETIAEHKETFDKSNMRDYIDMYLRDMDEQKNEHEPSIKDFSDLKATLLDLFAAGSETTSTSIRWYILYMAKYPEIQRKIHQEIDLNVPKDRFPSLEDKDNLPYFEASIYESMRIASLIPTSVHHAVAEDTKIDGYKIPKGTIVLALAEACHRSADYWERPNEFYPEHFIDETGKFYVPEEGFLPFSLGRRKCLGESLAKLELFLFLGAILQNFTIMQPEGKELNLNPDTKVNFTNAPEQFEIILKPI